MSEIELSQALIYIRDLGDCPPSYLYDPARKDFFEILWLYDELPLHKSSPDVASKRAHWIYLMPPYRVHQLNKAGKKGVLISFKRELLDESDKEFSLDVFRIFNSSGEFSWMMLTPAMIERLAGTYSILQSEYADDTGVSMIKSVLKVFLLQLIRMKKEVFTAFDINQKRAYEFLLLLEDHYLQERDIAFYATQSGLSTKRLNQVLKEVLQATAVQLLHDRLILDAKRQIIHGDISIKEIAWLLGFKDPPYFTRFFKTQTGQTPEEFQRHVKDHIKHLSNTLIE